MNNVTEQQIEAVASHKDQEGVKSFEEMIQDHYKNHVNHNGHGYKKYSRTIAMGAGAVAGTVVNAATSGLTTGAIVGGLVGVGAGIAIGHAMDKHCNFRPGQVDEMLLVGALGLNLGLLCSVTGSGIQIQMDAARAVELEVEIVPV